MSHFLSFNPHPSPSPQFSISLPQIPNPSVAVTASAVAPSASVDLIPVPDPGDASDILAAISLLQDLSDFAASTLRSISSSLSIPSPAPATPLGRCPFDPRHRVPPESLFRHSLICSSSPGAPLLDLSFLDTLHYPISFKTESEVSGERSSFKRPFPDSDSDLCFSLDAELQDAGSAFFYKGCPGVVAFPDADGSSKTFTLPAALSSECANFVSEDGDHGLQARGIRILPSDFWALKLEVEKWEDFPVSYSYPVLMVSSCLQRAAADCHLKRWVILHSPHYGIAIDAPMRDHLFVLLRLCLKAIQKEALSSLALFLSRDGPLEMDSPIFGCPRLASSFAWLSSQLSTLYGESNGRSFALGMLKESVISVGSSSMLFKLGEEDEAKGFGADLKGNLVLEKHSKNITGMPVYVSQIAAAVAALYERFLLEEYIKILRYSPRPPSTQIVSEHSYICLRGSEERKKRPDYRAVLDHDGLPLQRTIGQGLDKEKTREEILAEERDYKRRRMSYRGKKIKLTPTQVIRDIIEKHMEAIKLSGGIGSGVTALTKGHSEDATAGHKREQHKSKSWETRMESSITRKLLQSEGCTPIGLHGTVSIRDPSCSGSDLHTKDRQSGSGRHESENKQASRTPSRGYSQNQQCGQYSRRKERDDERYSRRLDRDDERYMHHRVHVDDRKVNDKYDKYKYHSYSRSRDGRHRISRLDREYNGEHDDYSSELESSRRFRSESARHGAFDDRYDPSSYNGN